MSCLALFVRSLLLFRQGSAKRSSMFCHFRRRLSHTFLQPPVGDLDTWASNDWLVVDSGRVSMTSATERSGFRTRTRPDQPEVRANGHADVANAIAAAKDSESKKRALDTLNKGMLAATSQAPQQALLRTWAKFHHCWFGGITGPYPITVSSLRAVAAMFKAGGYSSFRNYVFAAKGHHIRLGHHWDQCLDKTAKDCIRSVVRGLGPAKRTEPLDVKKAINVLGTWQWNETDMTKPVDSLAMISTAIIFLCREIEVSGALQHELEVADDGSSCTLRLPATKKDSAANGTYRSMDCTCGINVFCVPHHLRRYVRRLEEFGNTLGIDSDTLPLFPNPRGEALSKLQVIEVVRAVVRAYSPETPESEISKFTGHTFRVSGARWLSALGIYPVTVAIHGRWTSSAVMTYLAESPLQSLRARMQNLTLDDSLTPSKRKQPIEDGDSHVRVRERVLLSQRDDAPQEPVLPDQATSMNCEYVLNMISSKVHARKKEEVGMQTFEWRTLCGWKWAGKSHVYASSIRPDRSTTWKDCPKCFKIPDRGENEADSDSDSSSSTSSSSEG